MKISEATYNQLNILLQKSFDCNAQADNFAYNIDFQRYPNIGNIYHHSFAHLFPALADQISDLMIKLNARPVRRAVNQYEEEYSSLKDLFVDNDRMAEDYRLAIKTTIDIADLSNDYEVRIAMENFLLEFLSYVKQCDVWRTMAERYQNDIMGFDVHFEELTTFIPIQKD